MYSKSFNCLVQEIISFYYLLQGEFGSAGGGLPGRKGEPGIPGIPVRNTRKLLSTAQWQERSTYMYKYLMSSRKHQVYYIALSFCPFRALLVVKVQMGRRESQVHEVCLDRMVALGSQALLDFLLRSKPIAFSAKGVSKCAVCMPLSLFDWWVVHCKLVLVWTL